jgi:hypothetical protein
MMPPSPNAVSHPPSSESSNPIPSNPRPGSAPGADSRATLWLYRADWFLTVMVHLWVGLFLFFLPWMPWWTQNRFFLYYLPVAHLTQSGAVRGVVSGLGLLNLWIALAEALHFKES